MESSKYISEKIEGNSVDLVPMEPAHAADILKLFSTYEVTRFADLKVHQTIEEAEKTLKTFLGENNLSWCIYDKTDFSFAGIILVLGINLKHKYGSFASAILPEYKNKGIISGAHRMVTTFCFEKTDLNRLESQIFENHIAAEKMLIKSGMKFEGLLRGNFLIEENFENSRIYSVTRKDYIENKDFFNLKY